MWCTVVGWVVVGLGPGCRVVGGRGEHIKLVRAVTSRVRWVPPPVKPSSTILGLRFHPTLSPLPPPLAATAAGGSEALNVRVSEVKKFLASFKYSPPPPGDLLDMSSRDR